MQHKIAGRRLNMKSAHRKAVIRNMVNELIIHEKVKTTSERAKELRIVAEKLVTLAKRGDLHARRQALKVIRSVDAMQKLFDDYGKRFADRKGGYTRITKVGFRHGDNANMSVIEYLPSATEAKEESTTKKASTTRRKATAKKAPAKKADADVSKTKEKAKPAAKKKTAEKAEKPKAKASAKKEVKAEKETTAKPKATKAKASETKKTEKKPAKKKSEE